MTALTVPKEKFQATNEKEISLTDFKGQYLVLYFYPKDSTPGCTIESKAFRDHYEEFKKLNADIIGVSRDKLTSHEKFKCNHELPFELISDVDGKLCHHFNVLSEKSFFGKKIFGIVRSTFLIDPTGKVIKEWRKVKINGHVADVLSTLKGL